MKHTVMLKKSGFKKVYASGKSNAEKTMVMLSVDNGSEQNRLGVVASKKIGGAVVRNRARRRLKEMYRVNESDFRRGYDIVLIARSAINTAGHQELQKTFFRLAKRQRLFLGSEENHECSGR